MIVDQSLTSRPLHMTIEACPEGGWMVYTRAQEQEAFVQNTGRLRPLAAFVDLDLALRFIREQMAAGPGKPAASTATVSTAELKPIRVTSTLEWHKLSSGLWPQTAARLLLAIDDGESPRVEAGHYDGVAHDFVAPRSQRVITSVVGFAIMPTFPMLLQDKAGDQ